MNMIQRFLLLYVLTVPVFFALDMIWLGLIARDFYRRHMGDLMTPHINWSAAILFYLLYIAGILVFVVMPGLKRESLLHVIALGAFFGFVAYATYDLTNLATLRGWSLPMTIVDMIWGAVLTASVSTASFMMGKKLLGC